MTVHQEACERAAEDLIYNGGGPVLVDYVRALQTDHWSTGYAAAFAATGWRGTPNYGQVYAFTEIHARLMMGELALVKVFAGAIPYRDDLRRQNAAVLGRLPEPFRATLDLEQNCADDDGDLWWTELIRATAYHCGDPFDVLVPAVTQRFPLEVGVSLPSAILTHLDMYGAVARWPYGQDWLWVLIGLPTPIAYSARVAREISERVLG